jgi:UDP-N-acetylmuramoylalanine--D-glutamate ligase
MMDFKDLHVVVVGAARQGIALSRFLIEHGAYVLLNDRRKVDDLSAALDALADLSNGNGSLQWVLGGHPLSLLDQADLICVSGGVPLTLPLLVEAQKRNIPLSNDSQIFLELAPCKVVGITGSAGKTTTTSLLGNIAQQINDRKAAGFREVWVGGNIGSPLIANVDQMTTEDLAIMELSSFQLEIMRNSPQIAAVLNLSPNHLDRHGTMKAYRDAKSRILEFQGKEDLAVLGRDDPETWSMRSQVQGNLVTFGLSELDRNQAGIYLADDEIYWRLADHSGDVHLMSRENILLRGEHNLQNVMAACSLAASLGFPVEAMSAGVHNFLGVPHRLEFIRKWGGADWYNDSIATAPERSIAAINSFEEPLILLVGGRDKKLPWEEFVDLSRRRVDHLILFGEAAEKIAQAFDPSGNDRLTITRCDNLMDGVQVAAEIVNPGNVVLLSPGCTSFDEFTDFEERGECFAHWVRELP